MTHVHAVLDEPGPALDPSSRPQRVCRRRRRRRPRAGPTTTLIASGVALLLAACGGGEPVAPRQTPVPPAQPRRVAAEAGDLRRMFAEIAASRACDRLRDLFRATASESGAPVSGVTWIERCDATADGTRITLALNGRGWRWVSRRTEKVGATFAVEDHVRFAFAIEVLGTIDVAYARDPAVFTVWFTPLGPPRAKFEPIGEVEVDEEGLWASVVGGIASVFAASPEQRAEEKVAELGRRAFERQFARGIAITVDLCSGNVRSGFGHPPAGEMLGPSAAVRREAAVLHPGGLLVRGPLLLPPDGLALEVVRGDVSSQLVCLDDALALAGAYLAERALPAVRAVEDDTACPLVHVVRPRGSVAAEVRYDVSEAVARVPQLARCRE